MDSGKYAPTRLDSGSIRSVKWLSVRIRIRFVLDSYPNAARCLFVLFPEPILNMNFVSKFPGKTHATGPAGPRVARRAQPLAPCDLLALQSSIPGPARLTSVSQAGR